MFRKNKKVVEPPPLSRGKEGKTPVIIKIEDKRVPLTIKLADYKRRQKLEPTLDLTYKIAVVESLLEKGEVDTSKLLEELKAEYGDDVDERLFENAYGVINAYITGVGKLGGGTGFPSTAEREEQ